MKILNPRVKFVISRLKKEVAFSQRRTTCVFGFSTAVTLTMAT